MSLNFRDQITMMITGKTVKVQEIGVRAVTGPLRYESALQLADIIGAWMALHTPRVEIQTRFDGPSSCKVWFGERLVFDGVSRDALSQAPLDVSLRQTPAQVIAKIKSSIIVGISAEGDWDGPSVKPGTLTDEQIEWLASWLAGEGIR